MLSQDCSEIGNHGIWPYLIARNQKGQKKPLWGKERFKVTIKAG
jgi:hypothetical protein